MQVSVFGLGYVGVVSAVCIARNGHQVIGVDPQRSKVDLINSGASPIVETHLPELLKSVVTEGRLRASTDPAEAVAGADLILVCVGTPGHSNGSLDLVYVRRVCEQIGEHLRARTDFVTIAMRSTMLPGSMETVVLPAIEAASGKQASVDFGLCLNPEFLREGTAVYDFDNPPKTVIGTTDERAAATVRSIYDGLTAPVIVASYQVAEMVKYADNSWHALKVAFANEIGRICKSMQIDSRDLMQIFVQDTKLNVSAAYLRPGFAFGGSCLPKDVRALAYQARSLDVETPVLSAILASNVAHIEHGLSLILSTGCKRVGLLGLSFKEGTDDLRESPIVILAERLIGKGYEIRIFDRNVRLASLVGANRDYILNRIPHISRHLVEDASRLFDESDVIVVATAEREFQEMVATHGGAKPVIDLVDVFRSGASSGTELPGYNGIGW